MRILSFFVVIAACFVSITGCNKPVEGKAPEANEKTTASERILIPVEVAHPQRMDISAYFESTTRVMAENRVEVLSKGMGLCISMNVEEGDIVKAGDVLAELDKTEMEAQARQARVAVMQQKTAYEIAEKSLAEGIGAPVERDNTKFAYEQAKAALEMNEAQLRNQTVKAPINGVITKRTLQEGQLVSAGMPLFSIVDPESYALPIQVPEKEMARMALGQEAKVRIDSVQDREFTAHVRRINPSVDPLSGTVKVVLDFSPEDRQLLRDSAFARVRLVMQTNKNTLVVPKDAVLEENARTYLMVVTPELEGQPREGEPPAPPDTANADETVYVAQRVEIKTGLEDSNNIEVVSGIDESADVVVMGQHTLKQNALVTISSARQEIESRTDIPLDSALDAARKKSEEEAAKQQREAEAAAGAQ